MATGFLRWFVIQIAAYGLFALAAALLNTRRRFIAVAWAPIVNNIVCIGILVWFGLWAGHGASLASVENHRSELILLGLGTSLGVVFQGVALIPSLRNADLGLLRWNWNPRDDALRAVTRLGGWTFGFVLANQIALFVVTILAGSVAGPDPVSSYTYAYAFFQLPYGIVAVTVMSVVTPDLAERWSTGQQAAFLQRMTGGLRAVLALIIPAAVGMLLLAKPSVALLLGNGHSTPAETATTGAALAMFALGLPGFCTYLYLVRVLQSMQRTRVAFYLYLVENALNIVLALLLVHPLGVRGLALSLSIAYTRVGAAWRWPSSTSGSGAWPSARRGRRWSASSSPSCPWPSSCSWSPTSRRRPASPALLARVVGSVVAGGLTFGAVVIWLGRRHDAHRRPPGRPAGPRDPTVRRGRSDPTVVTRSGPERARRHRRSVAARSRRPGAPSRPSRGTPVAAATPSPPSRWAPRCPSARVRPLSWAARPLRGRLLHARRPHRHRQCLRPDRPARQGAQRHRGAAVHPLRRRGARGPAPAHPGRVLGALPRQG